MNFHIVLLFIHFFLVTLKAHDNQVRNIMLIGRTGNGKSTLANVLLNKNDEFEEVFKESSGSISGTKDIQNEVLKVKSGNKYVKYRIIDTVGLGENNITIQEMLKKIAKTIPFVDEGLHRIFFVIRNRFTENEKKAYLLKESIFDNEVVKYTTIINPWFSDFENETACKDDGLKIKNENQELADFIKSTRIIHVNTLPLKGSSYIVNAHKKARKASRQKLLAHLNNCQGTYHPSNLNIFKEQVWDYLSEEEISLRRELENERKLRIKLEEEERRLRRELEEKEVQKRELEDKERMRRRLLEKEERIRRRELEEEEKRLRKELKEKETKIRELETIPYVRVLSILGSIGGAMLSGVSGAVLGAVIGVGLETAVTDFMKYINI
ncbi:GTPase imap family member 7-like [Gigaspora margarita]|uniref:GTPase imap family member 7-like n=1 Tax=Gigaspora margarita TaxID=4874 RepID=A0A8H4AGD1_GIGMA|nr:GTPase imap family member 7-like [Gigaspora margarita]